MPTETRRESSSALMSATRRRPVVDTGAMSGAVRLVCIIGPKYNVHVGSYMYIYTCMVKYM